MKVSLNWLREYVDVPQSLGPEELAHQITMSTVEVEGYEDLSKSFANMVVGKITEVKPHPDADALRLAMTDLGDGKPATIVCGGSNLAEGMFVAVAQQGAKVRWHGEGDLVELKPAKIRGIVSEGMICAANEIGLSELFPQKDDAEIVDLTEIAEECSLEPGMPLARALLLDDIVFDIDNKSLTNRPDLWGHYGIAREIAAIFDLELKDACESFELPAKNEKQLSVRIEESHLSKRYIGVSIQGVKATRSPYWLRARLSLMDQRSIDLLVDLTNYVLFSLGQPTHVFDSDKLNGSEIRVRPAAAAEKALLLDEEEYELSQEDLVIADSSGVIALAGIMGGGPSSVTAKTTNIVLESANFNPIAVRRTATKQGIRTESSMRFEKGIDPARAREGVDLYLSLLKVIQPGCQIQSVHDCFPEQPEPIVVSVTQEFINARIGLTLSTDQSERSLSKLGFEVSTNDGTLEITVPSWRATGDVSIPEDIVEEVARIFGYDNLTFVAPKIELTKSAFNAQHDVRRRIRNFLAQCGGMHEILSYPWVEDSFLEAAGISRDECLALHAGPSPKASLLQPTRIPSLLGAIKLNRSHVEEFSLFEVANVFSPQGRSSQSGEGEVLPYQKQVVAGAVVSENRQDSFLKTRGIVEELFRSLPFGEVVFNPDRSPPRWVHVDTGLVIELKKSGEKVGRMGLIAGTTLFKSGIKHCAASAFEIDIDTILGLKRINQAYEAIPKYPVVDFDLAVLLSIETPWAVVEEQVRSADKLVTSVSFLNEYRGEQVPGGKKSVALRYTLCDPKATLSSKQVNKVADKIIAKLKKAVGAEMRAA